jgi:hypothetical protein
MGSWSRLDDVAGADAGDVVKIGDGAGLAVWMAQVHPRVIARAKTAPALTADARTPPLNAAPHRFTPTAGAARHVATGCSQFRLAGHGPLAEDMDMTSDVTVAPSKPDGH